MDYKEIFTEMDGLKSILDFQEGISERFDKDFKGLNSLFESLSDIYLTTVKRLRGRLGAPTSTGEKDEVTFLLLARIFNHSLSAYLLLQRGMLIDAAAVIRQVLETQWLLEYFYKYPHKVDKWMQGKIIKPSEVRRNLKLDQERSLIYDEYCKMTHNNIESARYFSGEDEDADCIVFGGYYNPLYLEQLFSELIIYLTTTLFIINYEYREELKDLTSITRKLNDMLKIIFARLLDISTLED
ncbi:DUF5677 domain-containing protein [Candidatus Contubernalis alkaliaceticus]|uniref:DUF5677 domain-containing protein n=1 Tax=Candidatus Contubernalis alkaliaceticus TaxID=338645 RepID=UPI001F4C2EA3|nr:DUF5677 domain-containing protein [Candidatus Contubernalis alkalaceticus]UNC90879.1 hypothetical protein HUE98_01525 [Candidatus Contubernalis alkalaceticus]